MDLSALQEAAGPRRLDIGCGANPIGPEWIGIDAIPYPGVKIIGDAFDVLRAIEAGVIDEIFTAHFLEHVEDLYGMVEEMTRVLKPGGKLTVRVPHWSNTSFWSDPTHKRTFGLWSFNYLAHSDLFSHPLPDYGNQFPLQLLSVRLAFPVAAGFGLRTRIMSIIDKRANASPAAQEFYETNVARIIGCNELQFFLERKA